MLSETERRTLESWAKRRKTAQGLALRARIVLACADGGPNIAVAARLGVSRATVRKWRTRFLARRLDGLGDELRPGVPRTITDAQVEEVVVRTLEQVPEGATRWSKRELARRAGISPTSVHRIWRAFGLQPWRTAAAILAELAAGQRPLTHAALDELPDSKTIRHLRSVLVATGALPPRAEHMIRLEHWITSLIAGRDDPGERQVLHRYATWHALRRLRRRTGGQHITHGQAVTVQRHVRAAITLLDWLTARGLGLGTARQGHLDTWLTSDHATHHREAGNFVRWARRQKLTRLDFAATKWDGPSGIIDTEARWHHARRLLHDDTLKPEDRVAGLLILLYAQGPAAISRLTLDHVHAGEQHVELRLGREPVILPEPLGALLLQLAASRRGHAALGDQGSSRWLFPGGQPGQPISAYRLAERLRQLGLRPGTARSTALFGLAAELPAALLARLLGIHISVAVAWQRASSGDWTAYAADYSKRQRAPADIDKDAKPGPS